MMRFALDVTHKIMIGYTQVYPTFNIIQAVIW